MGSLFDSGPSRSEIRRSEERAFEREQERLRLQEQKLRRRESAEIIQGQGVATTGNIVLGSDAVDETTGLEQVEAPLRGEEIDDGQAERDRLQGIRDRLNDNVGLGLYR
jgi:hypothetical protein